MVNKETLTELDKIDSLMTDESFANKSQIEVAELIRSNFKKSKRALFFESSGWFIIFDIIFGIPCLILGMLLYSDPINIEEREIFSTFIIISIVVICIGVLLTIFNFIKYFQLITNFRQEDVEALFDVSMQQARNGAPLKKAQKEYAKWAILYLRKVTPNE
ncbi:MAG: hypothetical protein ACTSSH_01580 [Candidatus Heimdallarchaeota archaeon]